MSTRALISMADGRKLADGLLADTHMTRLVGLLAYDRMDPGTALVLTPCNLVHTWFMKFAIDIVFIDRHGTVVRLARNVQPFRVAWGTWRAVTTIELPAGSAEAAALREGERLKV